MLTRLFSMDNDVWHEHGDFFKKRNRILNAEYPRARFSIQTLYLSLMRPALVRELLGTGPILPRISRMALLKRPSRRVALLVRMRAQRRDAHSES